VASEKQLSKSLETDWGREGEKFGSLTGGTTSPGHVAAVIAGQWVLPCPSPPGAPVAKGEAGLPELTDVVREGRFRGDEWVHDPAMLGVVFASDVERTAVQLGGHLAALGSEGWFVSTSQRLAIAAFTSSLSYVQEAESAEEPAGSGGKVGKLWGRARSAVSAVSDGIASFGSGVTVVWETPFDPELRAYVPRGRDPRGVEVRRFLFPDGSSIEVRTKSPAQV